MLHPQKNTIFDGLEWSSLLPWMAVHISVYQ